VESKSFVNPLYVDIKDKFGASTRVTFGVAVTPPSTASVIVDPVGSLTTATTGLLSNLNAALTQSDSNAFVQTVLSLTSILKYYRTKTLNPNATKSDNGLLSDPSSAYATANVSQALRVQLFDALLTFTASDTRPATTATVVETLQILNAIVGAPDELGGSITTNTSGVSTTTTLRETAANTLLTLTLSAFSNPNVTFTAELGSGVVNALDSLQAASLSDTSTGTITNGTTSAQREQRRMSTRFVSTLQLVTVGEMRSQVVGQAPVEHVTDRLLLSSSRQTLEGAAGLDTSPSGNFTLYSYVNKTSTKPAFTMPSTLWSNPPVAYWNYTVDEYGNVTATPTFGAWPSQVDISFLTYNDNIYQWSEAKVNDSTYSASLSSLQGFTFYEHSDPDDLYLDTRDTTDSSSTIPVSLQISNLSANHSIMITIPLATLDQIYYADCRFWNESLLNGVGNWSTDGCAVYSRNDTFITCACTHLTIFNAFLPPINLPISVSPDDLIAHPEGWITMLIIWIIFGVLVPVVYKQDKYKHYPKAVTELVLQHNFIVNPEKNTNPTKEKVYGIEKDMSRKDKFGVYKRNLIAALREEHSWFAAFHRHHLTGYSSVEQLTMCFLLILSSMAVAGFFFGLDQDYTIIDRVKAAIFTSLLMVPLKTIVTMLLSADPVKGAPYTFVQDRVQYQELTDTMKEKVQDGKHRSQWNKIMKEKEKKWKVASQAHIAAGGNGELDDECQPIGNNKKEIAGIESSKETFHFGSDELDMPRTPLTGTHDWQSVASSTLPQPQLPTFYDDNGMTFSIEGGDNTNNTTNTNDVMSPTSVALTAPIRIPQSTSSSSSHFSDHQMASNDIHGSFTVLPTSPSTYGMTPASAASPMSFGASFESSSSPMAASAAEGVVSPSSSVPPRSSPTMHSDHDLPDWAVTPTPSPNQVVSPGALFKAATEAMQLRPPAPHHQQHHHQSDAKAPLPPPPVPPTPPPPVSSTVAIGSGSTFVNKTSTGDTADFDDEEWLDEEDVQPIVLPRRPFPLCCLRQKPKEPVFEYRYRSELALVDIQKRWSSLPWYKQLPPARIFGYIWTILMMIACSVLIVVSAPLHILMTF
jgi:hypothetical protein